MAGCGAEGGAERIDPRRSMGIIPCGRTSFRVSLMRPSLSRHMFSRRRTSARKSRLAKCRRRAQLSSHLRPPGFFAGAMLLGDSNGRGPQRVSPPMRCSARQSVVRMAHGLRSKAGVRELLPGTPSAPCGRARSGTRRRCCAPAGKTTLPAGNGRRRVRVPHGGEVRECVECRLVARGEPCTRWISIRRGADRHASLSPHRLDRRRLRRARSMCRRAEHSWPACTTPSITRMRIFSPLCFRKPG